MKKYLPWLPPEFVNGQEVEFRSDSYSFGVVLWELFTGKKPFEDVVDLSNLFDVGRKAFPLDPSLIEVDVARFLFERCLQEQVSERPSSEEILKALEVNQIGFF
jgi:serine/threonine-protein kinase